MTSIKSDRSERLVLTAWMAFGAVLLTVYYRQVWALFALGPAGWVRSNYSLLAAVRSMKQLVAAPAPHFPAAWQEALARNAAALLGAGLVLTAALGLGALVLRLARVRPASPADLFLFRTALGLGALAYLSLGLAILGVYHREIVAALVALCASGTLIWLLAARSRSRMGGQLPQEGEPNRAILRQNAIWIIPFSAACLMALVGALAPEIEYDSLWYHLWLPKKWLEGGPLWASPLSSFQLRFLLPIAPLLSILGAEACKRLAEALPQLNLQAGLPKAILAGLLLLNLPPFLSLHEADRTGDLGWLTHIVHTVPLGVTLGFETQESYLSRKVPSYPAWRYINQHLPAGARILTFSGGDHLYSERERIWSDATVAHPAVWGAQLGAEAQALATLRRLGVTHLLVDRRQAAALEPGTVAVLEPELLPKYFRLEYEAERFSLYRFH